MIGRARGTAAGLALALGLSIVSVTPTARSQEQERSDVGLATYTVSVDRVGRFERLLERSLRLLRSGGSPDRPLATPGLRVFRAATTRPEEALFVLLAEPAAAGITYSIEGLLESLGGPEAEALLAEWRDLFAGAPPFATTMRLVDGVTPIDGLRARLEAQLGPVAGRGAAGARETARDRDRLERLADPALAVDTVSYEVTRRSAASWTFRWVANVRNTSLVRDLFGTLTVQLLDADRRVMAVAPAVDLQLRPIEQRIVSGELTVDATAAARVASARTDTTVR